MSPLRKLDYNGWIKVGREGAKKGETDEKVVWSSVAGGNAAVTDEQKTNSIDGWVGG